MSKKRTKIWPPIYRVQNRSGNPSFQVAIGKVENKRKRVSFPTLQEAETYAEQARIKRANEGMAAFTLSREILLDADRSNRLLTPNGVSIWEAAKYYERHVLAYKSAPIVREIVEKWIVEGERMNNRPRTLQDKKSRGNQFAEDFGERKLSEITKDELKDWLEDDEWEPATKIGYHTKISQLYNFALGEGWVDTNLTETIKRPKVEETTPEIFTVEEADKLLSNASQFGLLPYFALGFFAGIRSAEMMRLKGEAIKFTQRVIVIGPEVAKRRSQRIVEMNDTLLYWLAPFKSQLQSGPIVDASKFRWKKEQLLEAAGVAQWKANGLRHSFGSYHLAAYESAEKTSAQMGNSPNIVHKHYKALVTKAESERFWSLRPKID
jgi:integrase